MQQSGIRADQVSQVRGFADQRLRNPKDPMEASNRRISIIVQYIVAKDAGGDPPVEGNKESGEKNTTAGSGTESGAKTADKEDDKK